MNGKKEMEEKNGSHGDALVSVSLFPSEDDGLG